MSKVATMITIVGVALVLLFSLAGEVKRPAAASQTTAIEYSHNEGDYKVSVVETRTESGTSFEVTLVSLCDEYTDFHKVIGYREAGQTDWARISAQSAVKEMKCDKKTDKTLVLVKKLADMSRLRKSKAKTNRPDSWDIAVGLLNDGLLLVQTDCAKTRERRCGK